MKLADLDKVIALIERGWCREFEAKTRENGGVDFDSPHAVAWDVRGAFAKVLGMDECHKHAPEIYAHMTGRVASVATAFAKLADWNDQSASQSVILAHLRAWRAELAENAAIRRANQKKRGAV